jgi:membrane-associated phospholipid phosphatase
VLERWSHQFNTFPSGHVAVAVAAASSVASVSTEAGAVIGAVAAAIAIGAAAGGYHYIVDVILGLIVAGLALLLAGGL